MNNTIYGLCIIRAFKTTQNWSALYFIFAKQGFGFDHLISRVAMYFDDKSKQKKWNLYFEKKPNTKNTLVMGCMFGWKN